MKIALVQTNATIGAIDANTDRLIQRAADAARAGAELAVFPEQALIGYPAKDLLLREELIRHNLDALQRLARSVALPILVGYAEPNPAPHGRPLFNSVALLADGRVRANVRKRLLPTYDVFDEVRYFEPAGPQPVCEFGGRRLGVSVCEDLLFDEANGRLLYDADPPADLAQAGADVWLNLSASPYWIDKHAGRVAHLSKCAAEHQVPLLYVNQVGGNDELLFDGASCAFDAAGKHVAQSPSFCEDMMIVDLDDLGASPRAAIPPGVGGVHDALVMGIRDYVHKCGFRTVVLGLSGGIDSAVTAALAARALGPENVHGVAMPSRYSSDHSVADAEALAANLRIRFSIVPIESIHASFESTLAPHFAGAPEGVAEENVQARARGALLMAFSNKFGSLLLTTGNKSELAVGYCTLYGDMCGGLAAISDVPKTMVYALARRINALGSEAVIPENTIRKAPSAELRPDQFDQQTLPDYDVLDEILERYVEKLQGAGEIVQAGFERETVERVVRMIRSSEYKRQQAAPGLKVTSKAFGFGRRIPIAARTER